MPPLTSYNKFLRLPDWNGSGDFGLKNPLKVLEYLGNPQKHPLVIQVAGTNGKGSTAFFLANILHQASLHRENSNVPYNVALLTSPPLYDIRETCLINLKLPSKALFDSCLERIFLSSEKLKLELSKFEIQFIAGVLVAKYLAVDLIIVETGLGGKDDISNIFISPKIQIFTSISYDHRDIFGSTLIDIANAETSIVKKNSLVLVGKIPQVLRKIFEDLPNKKSFFYGRDFFLNSSNKSLGLSYKELENKPNTKSTASHLPLFLATTNKLKINSLGLLGKHQTSNAALAIKAAKHLGVADQYIQEGIAKTKIPGRLQIAKISKDKTLLLDVAHNPASIKALTNFLSSVISPISKDRVFTNSSTNLILPPSSKLAVLTIYFSVLESKDWKIMLRSILGFLTKLSQNSPKTKTHLILCSISPKQVKVTRNFVSPEKMKLFCEDIIFSKSKGILKKKFKGTAQGNFQISLCDNLNNSLDKACLAESQVKPKLSQRDSKANELIIVTGSHYLVSLCQKYQSPLSR